MQVLSGYVVPPVVTGDFVGEGSFVATAVATGPGCAALGSPDEVCRPPE